MKYEVRNRWTGEVQFTAEIDCDTDAPESVKRGRAVSWALGEGAPLSMADLSGANLIGAVLIGTVLSGADLSGADLSRANLNGADLSRADLSGANLSMANLSEAVLSRASLSMADLSMANLSGADLSMANLIGAVWQDGIAIQRAPLFVSGLLWPVIILDQHMQIGCELHSLAEWAAFDGRRIAAMDGREGLKFWRAYKDVLLAMARSDGRGVGQTAEGNAA